MIRVGTAGWSYPDWEGIVYPARKPRGFHPLRHLARYVDCVEVNASFYGELSEETTRRWVALVEERPDFRFSAKLHRAFTHEAWSALAPDPAARGGAFRAALEPLREAGRLACVLAQFPLSFSATPAARERLERIAALFAGLPLVLELRHRSWYEPDALASLAPLGVSLARIDLPDGPSHPPADAPAQGALGYLRLHGRNAATWFARGAGRDQRYDYLYAPDELDGVVRLARRLAQGRDETLVITNNHFAGKAVANALEILAGLGRAPRAPAELVAAYPRLARAVRAEGQPPLFG